MSERQVLELGDIVLQSGVTLRSAQLAYTTVGTLNEARDNVIVMPTYYGAQDVDLLPILRSWPALDASRYVIVIPNLFGNGVSTSPSNASLPFDRAGFPRVTVYDNVVCQHRLLFTHLGVRRIRLFVGFSMGAQQAFQWGCLYPELLDGVAAICGTPRTSPHNVVFLEGLKAALTADAAFRDGWYEAPPDKGLVAFSRIYAGWMYSQDLSLIHI